MSCSSSSVVVGSTTTCKANVSGIGSVPTGTVTWTSNPPGKFSPASCKLLSKGTCSVRFRSTAVGSVVLAASYGGDSKNAASAGTSSLTVKPSSSKTTVICRPTSVAADSTKTIKCTATVRGYSPTGNVTWSWTGTGTVSLPSGQTCTLTKGSCYVTFNGISSGTVTVKATYDGDADNTVSSGTAKLRIK